MKRTILLIISVFCFSSCSTYVFLERKVPSEMDLGYKPSRIAFINQYDYLADSRIKERHWEAYAWAIDEFARTLTSHPTDTARFIFKPSDFVRKLMEKDQQKEKIVDQDTIIALCDLYHTNMILVLDTLRLSFDWETIRDEDPDGSVSKTKNFFLFSNYYVSLYDSTGNLFKRSLLDESMHYVSRPTLSGLITFVPNLANGEVKIRELARRAGTRYANMFYPGIVREQRMLYGGKKLNRSNMLIRNHHFDEAIDELGVLSKSENTKLASKALHNLDVARELKQAANEYQKP